MHVKTQMLDIEAFSFFIQCVFPQKDNGGKQHKQKGQKKNKTATLIQKKTTHKKNRREKNTENANQIAVAYRF